MSCILMEPQFFFIKKKIKKKVIAESNENYTYRPHG